MVAGMPLLARKVPSGSSFRKGCIMISTPTCCKRHPSPIGYKTASSQQQTRSIGQEHHISFFAAVVGGRFLVSPKICEMRESSALQTSQ